MSVRGEIDRYPAASEGVKRRVGLGGSWFGVLGSAIGRVSSKRGTRRLFPRAAQKCVCRLPTEKPGKNEKRFRRADCATRQRAHIQIGACALIGAVTGWGQVLRRGLRRMGHAGQSGTKH